MTSFVKRVNLVKIRLMAVLRFNLLQLCLITSAVTRPHPLHRPNEKDKSAKHIYGFVIVQTLNLIRVFET